MDLLTIFDDMQRDQVGIQKAEEFIRDDPGRVPYLIVRKAGYFFGLEKRALEYFYSNDFLGYIPAPALLALAAVFLLPFVFLATTAGFGAVALPHTDAKTLCLLFGLAYITPHLLILAEDRFHMTLIPFLAVLAAAAVLRRREILASLRAPVRRMEMAAPGRAWRCSCWPIGASNCGRTPRAWPILLGPNGNTTYSPY